MALTVFPKKHKGKGDRGVAVRIATSTHQQLAEISEQTNYTLGELIAMAANELRLPTTRERLEREQKRLKANP